MGPIEDKFQRPLSPLSRVTDKGATSIRQKERGVASIAWTMAALMTDE